MTEPIVPVSIFQQALFDTIRAANVSAQQQTEDLNQPIYYTKPTFGPVVAPYILNHLANGNNNNV